MQQALAENIASIQHVNDELQQQNEELAQAYQLKMDTNRRKAAFIQDIYHQIRTPLNIIDGFAQVLSASLHLLPDEEVDEITSRMKESTADIAQLTKELTNEASMSQEEQIKNKK